MNDSEFRTFKVEIHEYSVVCKTDGLPFDYESYKNRAALVEEFDEADERECFCAIYHDGKLLLTVTQRASSPTLSPGLMIVPSAKIAFVGSNTRQLVYRLDPPERLYEHTTDTGFQHWSKHGDFVFMAAEDELACFNLQGEKLWSTFADPPYNFQVDGTTVKITWELAPEQKISFPIESGPDGYPPID